MKRNRTLLTALLLAPLAAAGDDLSWMRGANYVPSYAKNDIQQWMEYDPAVIDRELGYAAKLKLNTVRVFLNVAVFEKQPEKFLADFDNFLTLADKHRLKMMPVLFDSCFDPQEVDVNNYKGKNWIPSPGFPRLGDKDWPAMEKFIAAVVGKHRDDKRIVLWDVMNEPESTRRWHKPEDRKVIVDFLRWALQRTKQEKPVQPLGVGWAYSKNIPLVADLCDVLIIHNYLPIDGLAADIRQIKEMGKSMNKPVIINECVGRPKQPIEEALPVIAKEKVGWCFWELMIGSTQFAQGRMPYQGHIYPDGKCFSATEVAAILNPAGDKDDAEEIAQKAGFIVSEKVAKAFTEEGITFSPFWNRWDGRGPADGRLWYANTAGQTATKEVTGTSIEVIFKHGPDCGIASVTIDGKPAATAEIDTYAKVVDWNRKTVVAKNLPAGKHTVVVTVTGRKAAASSNGYVQIVNITGSEAGPLRAAHPASGPGPAVRIEKDVTYLGPERAEKADLYLPPQLEPGKTYPGIMIIHGGGWSGGDKGSIREQNIGTTLAAHGYVCMSVNYALATTNYPAFPQNIQDCKRAVRWLHKNAARFQLDASHIGAIGGSAGGHLTALLAVSGPDTGIDPKEDVEYSCRIQAAVPMYPHCASSWEAGVETKHVSYTRLWMFAKSLTEAPELWNSASPIKQLSKDDPPMLILHGTADKTTPLDQSTRLNEAAKKIGVPSELIVIEGAPHSFHLQPKQRDLRPDVLAFFDKCLKRNPTP
jgi:acetyl esterase/lipase